MIIPMTTWITGACVCVTRSRVLIPFTTCTIKFTDTFSNSIMNYVREKVTYIIQLQPKLYIPLSAVNLLALSQFWICCVEWFVHMPVHCVLSQAIYARAQNKMVELWDKIFKYILSGCFCVWIKLHWSWRRRTTGNMAPMVRTTA